MADLLSPWVARSPPADGAAEPRWKYDVEEDHPRLVKDIDAATAAWGKKDADVAKAIEALPVYVSAVRGGRRRGWGERRGERGCWLLCGKAAGKPRESRGEGPRRR